MGCGGLSFLNCECVYLTSQYFGMENWRVHICSLGMGPCNGPIYRELRAMNLYWKLVGLYCIYQRHFKVGNLLTFTFSGCGEEIFRKNESDIEYCDSDQIETSCSAFFRGSL